MKLREILEAMHGELEAAGMSANGVTASLAFSARKGRDGVVEVEFVDAGAMSKPRPEEIHHLNLSLAATPARQASRESPSKEETSSAKLHIPPALPPKRTG